MVPEIEPGGMVTYQFEIEDELWNDWKETVPRTKSLDSRIIELIEADADGVMEASGKAASSTESAGLGPQGQGGQDAPARPRPDGEELSASARALLEDELAGSGDLLTRRVDAVLSMYDVLRDRGEAEKAELLAAVDAGTVDYQSEESVWSNMVKGKDTLRALPGVEKPTTGRVKWKYTGEKQ